MKFKDKIKRFLNNIWIGFAVGMKTTEDEVFHQSGISTDGTIINQQVSENRVSKALLKGEVTQQVKELRYRTYRVDRESKNYEYYTPTLALKKNASDKKNVDYDKSDGLDVITIQNNKVLQEELIDSLNRVNSNDKVRIEYLFKLDYGTNHPRYNLDEFIKKVVVKDNNDGNVILDVYVSEYPDPSNFKSKGFVTEVMKQCESTKVSDIFDFNTMEFETSHSYRIDDGIYFLFKNVKYREIKKIDGFYIIKFNAYLVKKEDFFDDFYDEKMAKKYENKESKNTTVQFDLNSTNETEVFICEGCGKEIRYNPNAIDNKPIGFARMYDEEKGNDNDVIEYMDIQMSEQTIGKRLCKNCMEKQAEKLFFEYTK